MSSTWSSDAALVAYRLKMGVDRISAAAYLARLEALGKEYRRKVGAVTRRKGPLQESDLPSREKARRWKSLLRESMDAGEDVVAKILELPAPTEAEDAVAAYRAALQQERAEMAAAIAALDRGQAMRARWCRRRVRRADRRRQDRREQLVARLEELS